MTKVTEYLNANQGFFYTINTVLAHKKTTFQLAELVDTNALGRVLLLDGVTQVSTLHEERYHEPLVHPCLLFAQTPEHVLLLGGGDGGALREIVKNPMIQTIDFVDLDGEVIEFSKQYLPEIHAQSFFDKRVTTHIMDGRKFLENSSTKYDAIIMDMTDPRGPACLLYTKEFFTIVLEHLTANGVFSMHGESPYARPLAFSCIQKTLQSVFKTVQYGLNFVPMYGTLWSFFYTSNNPPLTISEKKVQSYTKTMSNPLRLISAQFLQSFFMPDPFVQSLEKQKNILTITDAVAQFPDDFKAT